MASSAVVLAKAGTHNPREQLSCAALSSVMPGLDPGIHVFGAAGETWMAGTSPAMTARGCDLSSHSGPVVMGPGFRQDDEMRDCPA
jgi:hypothetical protein